MSVFNLLFCFVSVCSDVCVREMTWMQSFLGMLCVNGVFREKNVDCSESETGCGRRVEEWMGIQNLWYETECVDTGVV